MRLRPIVHSGQSAGAVAAALLVAAIGVRRRSAHRARKSQPKDHARAEEAPPAKGPVQPLRKGAIGNAAGPAEPRRAFRAADRSGRRAAAERPHRRRRSRSPGFSNRARRASRRRGAAAHARQGAPIPRIGSGPSARAFGTPAAAMRAFGNQPGNRAFGNQPGRLAASAIAAEPRGFTNRDPRMRAVNAATPQLRQVQRFTPSRRDARDPRAHAALPAARRAQLHRHPAGRRDALRHDRNGLPAGDRHLAAARSRRSRASTI